MLFKAVLRLHKTDGKNKGGAVVRYDILDEAFLAVQRGVYLVTLDGDVVYCGKFTNTFAKRSLYTRGRYLYHFKRDFISLAIAEQHILEVHAQTEDVLCEQLDQAGNPWVSVSSIEEKLVRDLRPAWNIVGQQDKNDKPTNDIIV